MRRAGVVIILIAAMSAAMVYADDFEDALKEAESLYKAGKYREAAELCEKAVGSGSPSGADYYNLACYWSMAGETDRAFRALENSRELQGLNLLHLKRDEDLESLHGDPRWLGMMKKQCETEFDLADTDRKSLFRGAECYALAEDTETAFIFLEKAIDAGFVNEMLMMKYSQALEPLREDPRWKGLEAGLMANLEKAEKEAPEKHEILETIELPEPAYDSEVSIEQTLKERRSVRKYSSEPITMADCSQLLWAAYGVTQTREGMPAFLRGGLKTAPSAGARYPLELYLVAYNVSDLPDGIYWYSPEGHLLHKLADGDRREILADACWNQDWLKDAAISIVYSAVYERNTARYGDRGRERYVCMDLGHSGENVYLQCGSLGMGTCAIGAFIDIELKQAIGMTREEEPLYVMPVGRLAGE